MLDHERVTELTATCQLGVAAGNRSVSGGAGAPTTAQRLEDVEKFVRETDRELEAIIEYAAEMEERVRALEVALASVYRYTTMLG